MPINIQGNPSISIGGTTSVKIVAWDTTGAGSIPAGTAAIGAVSIIAGTSTQTVLIAAQPIGISGAVTLLAGTGTQNVNVVVSTVISVIPVATQGPYYQQNATAIAATGTGVLFMGIQSGATTSRAFALTTTAALQVFNVNTAGVYTIAGNVTLTASIPAGNVIIGSVNVVGIATTADAFMIPTGGSIRYAGTSTNVNQLWLTITTSAQVILVTSAANKVFIITSLWINGNTSAAFKFQSATTDIGALFIATSGVGMVLGHNDHGWHRTTVGQSLIASAAVSGSYAGWLSYITISG